MDERRFDRIARRLGHGIPRRPLIAAAAATVLAALQRPQSALACKKVGKKCDKNNDCCDGARCKGDTKKKKGKCRCKSGWKDCDGDKKCERLNTDEHCGSCGNACTPVQGCCEGTSCIELLDNNEHCGACGNACQEGTFCDSVACIPI
jgi:hypothetical protein